MRAEGAAELCGEGKFTAEDLIDFLDAEDLPIAATSGKSWWKALAVGYLAIKQGMKVTPEQDVWYDMATRKINKQNDDNP